VAAGRRERVTAGDEAAGGREAAGGAPPPLSADSSAADGAAAFKAFEAAGWSARARTYDALMARATALVVEPLLDAAAVGTGTRVLDVGCGIGTLAAAAAARGATVTGVDLAEGMLAEARRRHPGLEFVHGDAEALPFADGAFDVALGAFVVNHLPRPERAAAELSRVARRVALAMWGPEEEVGILGLPARAAAGLAAGVPPGPDSLRFTDAGELAALIGGTVTETKATLHIDDLDELWDGVRGGTVRTAARLEAATPAQLTAARRRLAELAEAHRAPAGYDLPITIRIAT
jgi:SAM-dependent methyltransferase